MKLALFDIDGTLVNGQHTEPRFVRYLWQRRCIGWRQGLSFAAFTLRYLPRYGSGVMRKNKAYLAGLPEAAVCEMADEFVRDSLVHAMNEVVCARLSRHLERGDSVWLLSGTIAPIARSLAAMLGVDNVIATRYRLQDGAFASAPPTSHPYGKHKLMLAQELCEATGHSMRSVVAYADSWSDRHLMEAAGKAVAVMPDRRLAALAVKRRWEIMDSCDNLVIQRDTPGSG